MLVVLSKAAENMEKGKVIPVEVFEQALDFIRNFADRCHHGKEEDILFKLMAERGILNEGGPIGQMFAEHDQGRQLTRGMAEAIKHWKQGDESARKNLVINAQNYVQLLTQHIYKENNILYPMGDRIFSQEDQKHLQKEFERVEKDVIGPGVHEEYHLLVEQLEAIVRNRCS
jgi:hemerythrin-like domain-containing protein